ncbi:putative ABC transporter ATP-binding protein TDE_0282 [uncultured Sporomusa sp.]|uniref:Putative ABC transporter ATP-binding protein TDE_0282 n=1 Tax=uncultured Sporomusa sp. TaxID=307249 RepID=A0A212LVJ2_9FIRM|nr:energy-coupling factor ABC transporter ATP-binding protein [uncultured Sporomusa sp.]SCM81429.1 putative ABC transporter ATP-binding protein TDE_0282 [uncultured Sporomusa sp.]
MICLQNVSFAYQDSEADGVRQLSLHVQTGECLLLCGRSGCGKTTVTRLINGLIPHFYNGGLTGRVEVAGMDIAASPMYAIAAKVGSVFQNPRSQFFNVDTDSEIAFGLENMAYPADEIGRRVAQTARELKLEKLLNRNIFALSGGEKQSIAFASVFALSPAVYVLDEPSANLDARAITELRNLLRLLKAQGKTIVIAEHRLHYLQDIADRIVYLENGSIRAEYTGREFWQLDAAARRKQGLRAGDLRTVGLPPGPKQPDNPVLELHNLTIARDRRTIVTDIRLTASRGDIIGVIGNNGSGKSTLVQTLCGLRQEQAGRFCWEGRPVDRQQRLALAYIVLQDVNHQLFAETVEEECLLGNRQPDKEEVTAVLCRLSLEEYRDRHPMSLSGGQKQRVAVAVSQLCNKEILIFDEPTSGLDCVSMLEVSRLIGDLAAAGKVIFVVTHDYELLVHICNRVIWLADGAVRGSFAVGADTAGKLLAYFVDRGEISRTVEDGSLPGKEQVINNENESG